MSSEFEIADAEEIEMCLNCKLKECVNCIEHNRARTTRLRKDGTPKYHRWSFAEMEYIAKHRYTPAEEIAKALNMTVGMVVSKRERMRRKERLGL